MMELVAARESDSDGLAYLVKHQDHGYIIEDGEAQRVNLDRALSYDSWEEPVPFLSIDLVSEFTLAIEKLKADEFAREGRLLRK